jgi:GT2 family glycosyltransferase
MTGFLVDTLGQLLQTTVTLAQDMTLWANTSEQAIRCGEAWKDYVAFIDRFEALLDGRIVELPGPRPILSTFTEQDVTVVIPVHNQWELTERMVRSIQATSKPGHIIVVDNGSTDETRGRLGELGVEHMRHDENLGYAGAVMSALDRVKTRLVLIANNDMECIVKNWLAVLVSLMEPAVGIIGPKLLYPDGRLQFAGGLIDWNRPDIGFHRWYGKEDHPCASAVERVPFVTGACLLARKELLTLPRELEGGLNYEDTHWCLNAWYSGYEVRYAPTAALVHYEARTKRAMDTARDDIVSNRKAFMRLWHERWIEDDRMSQVRNLNEGLMGGGVR